MSFACAVTLRSMTSRPCAQLRRAGPLGAQELRVQPEDRVSGVRSSCESVVRNSSFMRLASRASALSVFSIAIELICASCTRIASSSAVKSPSSLSSRCSTPMGRPSRP